MRWCFTLLMPEVRYLPRRKCDICHTYRDKFRNLNPIATAAKTRRMRCWVLVLSRTVMLSPSVTLDDLAGEGIGNGFGRIG